MELVEYQEEFQSFTPKPEMNPVAPKLTKELSEEERKRVEELVNGINLSDSSAVMQYGAPAQTKISKFSDNVLQNVRTKDTGEVGKDLTDLVTTIKEFDTDADKKPRFALFRNTKNRVDKLITNFSSVETNIDKIVTSLENHQRQLLKDLHMLDTMYQNNYSYFKELSLYIIAGEEKLQQFRDEEIPVQRKVAEETGDQMQAQKLRDMVDLANRFEKKLHDLTLSRTISVQMAPQIRLIQNNNTVLIEKIQSSIVNSIPLWKNQIVIALGIANSQKALQAQREVTDMTNALLQKNSEMLKQGSLSIAEEGERSIVSIETLQKTNTNLIETINGVLEIQKKGSEARQAATQELAKIEEELKQTLLDVRG
ncbi:MAG: toxic anion resistance protein [Defluviitaleaceae bacterium]|nr:toxic anion resistance protein [Defluviitaleaceae bacterium]